VLSKVRQNAQCEHNHRGSSSECGRELHAEEGSVSTAGRGEGIEDDPNTVMGAECVGTRHVKSGVKGGYEKPPGVQGYGNHWITQSSGQGDGEEATARKKESVPS